MQQVAFPVILLLVIPFGLLSSVIQNPSTTKNVILSLIPFFSPTLMLARMLHRNSTLVADRACR